MKKVFIITSCAFILVSCEKKIATSSVPQNVQDSFKAKYPEATNVEWELEKGNYEAEFKIGSEKKEAEFSNDGTFIKEEK